MCAMTQRNSPTKSAYSTSFLAGSDGGNCWPHSAARRRGRSRRARRLVGVSGATETTFGRQRMASLEPVTMPMRRDGNPGETGTI
jgi:hypothetical protein